MNRRLSREPGRSPRSSRFSNKTMLFLGGTVFVGKVLLAMVLDRFPELKHVIVQVRRKKTVSGEQRFYSEILQSPPLRPIVDRIGESVVRQKIKVVEGDLDQPLCGISAENIEQLKGRVDIVVNLAGVVDFDPPVNESVEPNVYGTATSDRTGEVAQGQAGSRFDKLRRRQKRRPYFGRHADRRIFPRERDKRPNDVSPSRRNWSGTNNSSKRPAKAAATNPRPVRERLREGGMDRADYWGWTNTYTYTKSMGEQLIAQTPGSGVCDRPSCNRGIVAAFPVSRMERRIHDIGASGVDGRRWRQRLAGRKDGPLEIIPVDIVAAGNPDCDRRRPVRQKQAVCITSLRPIRTRSCFPRLVAFLGMNSRYKHKHKRPAIAWRTAGRRTSKPEVISVESFRRGGRACIAGLDVIHAALTLGKTLARQQPDGPLFQKPA